MLVKMFAGDWTGEGIYLEPIILLSIWSPTEHAFNQVGVQAM